MKTDFLKINSKLGIKYIVLLFAIFFGFSVQSQKLAFVDTDYILKRIPAYEAAQEQLNTASAGWQKEVEALYQEVSEMYKKYQTESVFLSNEMKVKQENLIVEKEKEAKKLQQKYFGSEGELFKKREMLIKPIQDDIYAAISVISTEEGYGAVFDKASNVGVIFADPKLDISDDVLKQMGITQ
ncbi:MAG: OmpH family outer membrane protein [Marinilabiliaceae bacterium]|nr:OmpH family outer membrane protein [Marinilabiliaceae bacterium]